MPPALRLERFEGNPIIEPIESHAWESKAAFNPGAVQVGGKVHLLYRAIGDDDVSVLGYAASAGGLIFNERLPRPAYVPREPFEGAPARRSATGREGARKAVPAFGAAPAGSYASGGGGAGGCEDPKLTRIGDRIYMPYVAYDGWSPPRVALTSISVEDFLAHRWNWSRPVLISRPGVVDKSAAILPEKVRGKYVIFHRIFPNILVDFIDNLDAFDGQTVFLQGECKIEPRENGWDKWKLSVGAPPLKTDKGWLLIYHAIDAERDPFYYAVPDSRYKIGAMLLDLADPTQVIARSRAPILEPEAWYENAGWKWGVVYPGGAVVQQDTLIVYYGAADRVAAAATAPMRLFLEELARSGTPTLTPLKSLPGKGLTHGHR